ncbi:hypothetical protein GCM10025781_27050 [Kocuria gwangalliensis]|uniref:Uncharacterized protein n=1 Tax=Kocuria gwangalliensis TaxID=501592 RepID=A0ABP8XGB3_9MICC
MIGVQSGNSRISALVRGEPCERNAQLAVANVVKQFGPRGGRGAEVAGTPTMMLIYQQTEG